MKNIDIIRIGASTYDQINMALCIGYAYNGL